MMTIKTVTIKWSDDGFKEDVDVAIGYTPDDLPNGISDEHIFFYFETPEEFEDYQYPGQDFRIININR